MLIPVTEFPVKHLHIGYDVFVVEFAAVTKDLHYRRDAATWAVEAVPQGA